MALTSPAYVFGSFEQALGLLPPIELHSNLLPVKESCWNNDEAKK
jgi:hypothetical protein